MDPFFSCRKASKGRPLQGAASGSTGASVMLAVREDKASAAAGAAVVVGGVVVMMRSSSVANVSPRAWQATEEDRRQETEDTWVFKCIVVILCCF